MSENNDLRWLNSAINLEPDRPMQWEPAELAEMLRHQLATPIREDLGSLSKELVRRYDQPGWPGDAGEPAALTFGELFSSLNPPLEVLRIVKDYAKQAIEIADGPIPEELGAVLYYASICCALLRCGQSISRLDPQAMGEGLEWALGQPWLNDALRELFTESTGRR